MLDPSWAWEIPKWLWMSSFQPIADRHLSDEDDNGSSADEESEIEYEEDDPDDEVEAEIIDNFD